MKQKYTFQKKQESQSSTQRLIAKVVLLSFVVVLGGILSSVAFFVSAGRQVVTYQTEVVVDTADIVVDEAIDFPVGVNPSLRVITENPAVDEYFRAHIRDEGGMETAHSGFFGKVFGRLALIGWYQNLASLSSRILVIESGERKEQVTEHFGKILGWNKTERDQFLTLIEGSAPLLEDGKFYPGTYTVERKAKPEVVAPLVLERFNAEVLTRYTDDVESVVPLNDALIIASLLEREAYDFEDMRLISGVIWNRLFAGMRLQLDATLQYAKGSDPSEPWWPKVAPSDKYIASVYNTYKNTGLPPAPIANPSLESILAALNPKETECMYYFHDKKAGFHCTETYEEHVKLLKEYYGRGK